MRQLGLSRGLGSIACSAIASFGVAACQPDDTFRRVNAELDVEPEVLAFGETVLGGPVTLAVSARNTGTGDLRVCLTTEDPKGECLETTRLEPADAPISAELAGLSESGTWDVPSGATRQFLVEYSPVEEGPVTASLILVHNGANGPATTIPITGSAVAPNVTISPESLDFGELAIGARRDLELVLTNGTAYRQEVQLTVGDQASVDFGVATSSGVDAPPGEPLRVAIPGNGTIEVKVWFRPNQEGPHANTVTATYCPRADCVKSVALTGSGTRPVFSLSPPSLDFGSLREGEAAARSFTIRNTGTSLLNVLKIERETATTEEYTVSPASLLPARLEPGEALVVDVVYLGVTPGLDTGRVEISTDGYDDPNTTVAEQDGSVALTATSLGPDINAVPAQVSFGTIDVGTESTQRVVLENSGNEPLSITSATLDAGEITFSTPPALPATLMPGATLELVLRYAPQSGGADTATLRVSSNDRDEGELAIPVQGVGGLPNVCTLSVSPSTLRFGLVPRGRTVQLPVRLDSVGAQPCTLSNIRFVGAPELGIISGAVPLVSLPTGMSHTLDVAYAPTVYGTHAGRIELTSNDPLAPNLVIEVSGASGPSDLLVVPPELDFGVVPVSCRSPNRSVTLYNTGANNLQLTDVSLDPSTSAEMELTPFLTPMTLVAGASSTLNLRYRPSAVGRDTGVLFVTHDGAIAPVAVPLLGEGQTNPVVTDSFAQNPAPADVLFIIDNSCSMEEEQNGIGTNLAAFLGFAQGANLDYQIAVTTTDTTQAGEHGVFVGGTRIITPATVNASGIFAANVSQGIEGSPAEAGLEAAYLALSEPLISGANAGFLRPHAGLAVIIVSDEEDQSSRNRSFYESFFTSLKGPGNAGMVTVSAIVGTTNPECNSPNGVADYAPRYILTAQATGGVVESICSSNWAQALQNIGFTAFGLRRRFYLSSQPVVATISVRVDGAVVPATTAGGFQNWQYEAGSNSVVFQQGAEPQAYSNTQVTYSVACLP